MLLVQWCIDANSIFSSGAHYSDPIIAILFCERNTRRIHCQQWKRSRSLFGWNFIANAHWNSWIEIADKWNTVTLFSWRLVDVHTHCQQFTLHVLYGTYVRPCIFVLPSKCKNAKKSRDDCILARLVQCTLRSHLFIYNCKRLKNISVFFFFFASFSAPLWMATQSFVYYYYYFFTRITSDMRLLVCIGVRASLLSSMSVSAPHAVDVVLLFLFYLFAYLLYTATSQVGGVGRTRAVLDLCKCVSAVFCQVSIFRQIFFHLNRCLCTENTNKKKPDWNSTDYKFNKNISIVVQLYLIDYFIAYHMRTCTKWIWHRIIGVNDKWSEYWASDEVLTSESFRELNVLRRNL